MFDVVPPHSDRIELGQIVGELLTLLVLIRLLKAVTGMPRVW